MKIIFLDIDGVLNHENWIIKRVEDKLVDDVPYPLCSIDPDSVKELNRIIEETGAKVVISSTWRSNNTIESLTNILNARGFKGEIIDFTPHLYVRMEGGSAGYSIPRGCEIEWWLGQKGFQRINWSIDVQREYLGKSKIKNYVILDDDSDMLYGQREHFVLTSGPQGLDKERADRSIRILNKALVELYYEME